MATQRVQYDSTSMMRAVRVSRVSDAHVSEDFDIPRQIEMSQRDFKLFLVSIGSDEEPSEKLKALFSDDE
jgi:hypothetical protein